MPFKLFSPRILFDDYAAAVDPSFRLQACTRMIEAGGVHVNSERFDISSSIIAVRVDETQDLDGNAVVGMVGFRHLVWFAASCRVFVCLVLVGNLVFRLSSFFLRCLFAYAVLTLFWCALYLLESSQ